VLKTGEDAGFNFVYAGNLGRYEDTYCPVCGELLVSRSSIWMSENKIDEGMCPKCGAKVAGVWE
jgi:pyruvate formate lyase activating enzyme